MASSNPTTMQREINRPLKTNRILTASHHRGSFANRVTYCTNPASLYFGSIFQLVREIQTVQRMNP